MLCLIIITIFSTYLSLHLHLPVSLHISLRWNSLVSPCEICKVGQELPTRLAAWHKSTNERSAKTF